MSERLLPLDEIEKLYPNEWVLVDIPNPRNLRPDRLTHGSVVMHTPDRAEINRYLMSLQAGELPNIGVWYNGPPILDYEEDVSVDLPSQERNGCVPRST